MISRSYRWRHFDGRTYACTFEVDERELRAAQAEFGIAREKMTLTVPGYEFRGTYRTPEEKARLEREAEEAKRRWEQDAERLRQEHEAAIQRAGFLLRGDALIPDLARLHRLNVPRVRGLAQQLRALAQANAARDRGAAELMLSFVQELPYRVPPAERGGLFTGELLTPLEVLAEGWGDCDSKSLLFATLVSGATRLAVILLRGSSHMLAGFAAGTGLEGEPRGEEQAVTFGGRSCLLCEVSAGVWPPGHVDEKIESAVRAGEYGVVSLP
jgi:hypothetical protein